MGFVNDLNAGKEVENEFAEWLHFHPSGLLACININAAPDKYHPEFDINAQATFEIKADFASKKYGNFCFEEAGLNKTEATHYVYKYWEKGSEQSYFIIFKTEQLKQDIQKHLNNAVKVVKGGDGNRQTLYIYSISYVRKNFRYIY